MFTIINFDAKRNIHDDWFIKSHKITKLYATSLTIEALNHEWLICIIRLIVPICYAAKENPSK